MKKRICFLVDSIFSIGGVQRVTAVIAKELSKSYDITIVTFDKPETKNLALYDLGQSDIHYHFISYPSIGYFKNKLCKAYSGLYMKLGLKSKWSSNIYAYSSFPPKLQSTLINELKQGEYNVIIGVHAPLAARLSTIRKNFPNSLLFGWLHNSFEALFGESFIYIGAARKRHYIYQFLHLNHVIVLCQDDAKKYHDYDNSFTPDVIYNPLTLQPGTKSKGTSKRFLTIGRFVHSHKGIDILIKAFYIFSNRNAEWELDIVGEGVEEEMYQRLIKSYHLEHRIHIHPFTNNIQHYYSNAQIYVLSSRWEGMPLVLVEAMSHGLPIVSSGLPVCQEIMGDFGLYFKNGDIDELAQRLEDATKLDWAAKSKEAITISQRFEVAHIIKQWKQLIETSIHE